MSRGMTRTSLSKNSDSQPIPDGWQPTEKTIHRSFPTRSFVRGVEFISGIRDLAEAANHHPDIILTFPTVIVTLTTHDESRVTSKDLALAVEIDRFWSERFGKENGAS